jgi:hypothetical protein
MMMMMCTLLVVVHLPTPFSEIAAVSAASRLHGIHHSYPAAAAVAVSAASAVAPQPAQTHSHTSTVKHHGAFAVAHACHVLTVTTAA